MLELGIDEITIVLQITEELKRTLDINSWAVTADNIVDIFAENVGFNTVLGEKRIEPKRPDGYTEAFTFGEHSFYLACAFHETAVSMGICIKISAGALDFFLDSSGLTLYEFLKKAQHNSYKLRVSRIDFTADYIDEDFSITEIYQGLMDGHISVVREYINPKTNETALRICKLDYKAILNEADVSTIYIGSKKSDTFMRIYDKRLEQIEHQGRKLDKAMKTHDWIRFEAVFRRNYAHQIGEKLLEITTDAELADFIAGILLKKYSFYHICNGKVDVPTDYTQMLMDATIGNYELKSPTSRNYDLVKQILYMLGDSGTLTTLYKIFRIWNDKGLERILQIMIELLKTFEPNADCRTWLRFHEKDYKKIFTEFDDFIKDTILPVLEGR